MPTRKLSYLPASAKSSAMPWLSQLHRSHSKMGFKWKLVEVTLITYYKTCKVPSLARTRNENALLMSNKKVRSHLAMVATWVQWVKSHTNSENWKSNPRIWWIRACSLHPLFWLMIKSAERGASNSTCSLLNFSTRVRARILLGATLSPVCRAKSIHWTTTQ